jgi:hypothetical protein
MLTSVEKEVSMRSTLRLFVALALCAVGGLAVGQEKAATAAKAKPKAAAAKPIHVVMNEGDIKWGEAPPDLPPGAKMAVLQGNPAGTGLFTIRLKAGDGYKVPAHWHPTTEFLTVISGTFVVATGNPVDETKATELAAGGFASMPAKMRHSAWTKGDTEVEVSGNGPFKIIYVNPEDNPNKAAKKK